MKFYYTINFRTHHAGLEIDIVYAGNNGGFMTSGQPFLIVRRVQERSNFAFFFFLLNFTIGPRVLLPSLLNGNALKLLASNNR